MKPSSDPAHELDQFDSALPGRDERFMAAEGQVSCVLGGEVVILELGRGVYYGMEGVGARVWELLQSPARPREILNTLLREYEVDPSRCAQDLLQIIEKLHEAGLIRRADVAE